ncbi:hypothetical protein XELAEV_18011788mg [Xenopus laevis]|uniref:Uncharacterized protein n=1 Tax=Xenopus laevis TaxID=8355 RepID=A0A974DP27_XENLA|nr:hypothetical protein XELAEV_18011788mg [Xenopus laevis]
MLSTKRWSLVHHKVPSTINCMACGSSHYRGDCFLLGTNEGHYFCTPSCARNTIGCVTKKTQICLPINVHAV